MRRLLPVLAALGLALAACHSGPMPGATGTVMYAEGAASSGRLPCEEERHGLWVPARVNGRPVSALVDTGAEATVIDRAFATEIGLATSGTVRAAGIGGTQRAGIAPHVTIEVGALRLEEWTVVLLDHAGIERVAERRVPLILGADVLARALVEHDPDAGTVEFHDPARAAPPPGAVAIPLRRAGRLGRLRSVDLAWEGGPPVPLTLDTGSGSPLLLWPPSAERARIFAGRRVSSGLGVGIGGCREVALVSFAHVSFAGMDLARVPAALPDEGCRDLGGMPGLVGLPVLRRFRWTADYARGLLHVVPDPAEAAREFPRDRLGLSLLAEGDVLVVAHVAAGSAAEAAGFATGERVVSVDGVPAASWSRRTLSAHTARPAGTAVVIGLEGGARRRVVLADAY